MSTYRITINDYHSIHRADIKLDGITVLTGSNGCGKSTISRWLYYIADIATQFDKYVIEAYRVKINNIYRALSRIIVEMSAFVENDGLLKITSMYVKSIDNMDEVQIVDMKARTFIMEFTHLLDHFLDSNHVSEDRKSRVLNFLGGKKNTVKIEKAIDYEDYANSHLDMLLEELHRDIQGRSLKLACDFVHSKFKDDDNIPEYFHFYEDSVDILNEKSIGTLFNVNRCIYIDTPMALNNMDDMCGNVSWARLRKMMQTKNPEAEKIDASLLLFRILNLIDGKITQHEDMFGDSDLYYERPDGLSIPLEKVATGMKTFSYIMQLVKNGYIDDKTILLIDEPEAHLHPQWIVEYARLLVKMHKELGVKIMVASHNPDMVAALQSIAKRENVSDKLNMYLGTKSTNKYSFDFEDVGTDIEPIFESFNIALTKISQYGDTGN